MMMKLLIAKCIALGMAPALLVLNFIFWHSRILGAGALLLWLIGIALLLGHRVLPHFRSYEKVVIGLILELSLLILAGSACFYLWSFHDLQVILLVMLISWVAAFTDLRGDQSLLRTFFSYQPRTIKLNTWWKKFKIPLPAILNFLKQYGATLALASAYLALFGHLIQFILAHATDRAIRSPWEMLPPSTIILYFIATFLLLLFLFIQGKMRGGAFLKRGLHEEAVHPSSIQLNAHTKSCFWNFFQSVCRIIHDQERVDGGAQRAAEFRSEKMSLIAFFLTSLHFFLTLSIALLVYKVGYGFDPFVHRATETLLADQGTITPKPLMYMGQYVLTVFLSKLSFLSIFAIDRWLLPLLASLLLPSLVVLTANAIQKTRKNAFLPLLLLLLPLSLFIFTVPLSLGYLFLLALLGLSFLHFTGEYPLPLLWLISLAGLAIHPMSGLPAIIYMIFFTIVAHVPRLKHPILLSTLGVGGGALALPALIAWGNRIYGNSGPAYSPALSPIFDLPSYVPFLSLAHTSELWMRVLPFFSIVGIGYGIYTLYRRARIALIVPPLLASCTLFMGYLVVRKLPLPAIIAYEREEFVARMLTLAFLCLMPFLVAAFQGFLIHVAPRLTLTTGLIIAALVSVGFYYTYPRVDAFGKSRGYSVSRDDISAVQWIEADAQGAPFIVLANQSVAAAALQEFGFKQYFTLKDCILQNVNPPTSEAGCKLFYYPIPTSSPLYQYYLDMVYKEPSRETAIKAMDLAGVNRAYFVLNDYWLDADKIAERAEFTADASAMLNSIRIFTYHKTDDPSPSASPE